MTDKPKYHISVQADEKDLETVMIFMDSTPAYWKNPLTWNDLMPVVEKIESIYDDFHGYFGVHISSNSCSIQGTKLRTDPENYHPAYMSDPNAILSTKIESTWYNLVEFIKWYNQNNKK